MSILKKFSDVLKEVFWIKTSSRRVSSKKKVIKRSPKKTSKKKALKSVKKPLPILTNQKEVQKTVVKKSVLPSKKQVPLKAVKSVKTIAIDQNLTKVGQITHYFERIGVCVVRIDHGSVIIGDKLTIVGQKSKFVQKVWSMQIESQDVKIAKKGQLIGLKIDKPAAVGDIVYK